MAQLTHRLAVAALVACSAVAPAFAASSTSSAASDSVGSVSGSIQKSSNSSSNTVVAEGEYRIVDVAAVAEQPGMARMKLRALVDRGADGEFYLLLPQQVVDQGRLAVGGVVTARHKAYGLEFAHAQTQQGFFLVLHDEWLRDLQTRPVVL